MIESVEEEKKKEKEKTILLKLGGEGMNKNLDKSE